MAILYGMILLLATNIGLTAYVSKKNNIPVILSIAVALVCPVPLVVPGVIALASAVRNRIREHTNPDMTELQKQILDINTSADKSIMKLYEKSLTNIMMLDKLDSEINRIEAIRDKLLDKLAESHPISEELRNLGRKDRALLLGMSRENYWQNEFNQNKSSTTMSHSPSIRIETNKKRSLSR